MLSLMPGRLGPDVRFSRRSLLQMGAVAGAGLSLPMLHGAESRESVTRQSATAKRCIYIFLCGGPSQLDMWDPKPEAPAEIRGPITTIPTNVPGIFLGDVLPQVARRADKFAIVRSLHHDSNSHDTGIMYTLMGSVKPPLPNSIAPPQPVDLPPVGAALHALLPSTSPLPAWVVLPRVFTTLDTYHRGQTAGFLGPRHAPFALDVPKTDSLARRDIEVQALLPPAGVGERRADSRKSLLKSLDTLAERSVADPALRQINGQYQQVFSLLSGGGRSAFELHRESPALRERYGLNEYGQSFLLARRLVEAGVQTVNVFWTYYGSDGCQYNLWDNHGLPIPICGGKNRGIDILRHEYCTPSFDRAFSALLDDLDDRGMLDDTLVVVIGEFGRTPKINDQTGRDHWCHAYSAVLAGGGVRGGQVYGATDSRAAYVKDMAVTVDDFTATIYHAFGFSPETPLYDNFNRPHRLSDGKPILAVL
jgi:hypothetical protein